MARALVAFHEGDRDAVLTVRADEGEAYPMEISLFFRSQEDLRDADLEALARARGRVLDVGASVGSVSLALQAKGFRVTAIEVIPEAAEIMSRRGVLDIRCARVEELGSDDEFDTVLLLMNGVALAGTLASLPGFLRSVERLLAVGGQILLDSTDLGGTDGTPGAGGEHGNDGYPGELQYQMEFRGVRGAPFPQLFVDPETLDAVAGAVGLRTEVVWWGEDGEYLARLTRGPRPP